MMITKMKSGAVAVLLLTLLHVLPSPRAFAGEEAASGDLNAQEQKDQQGEAGADEGAGKTLLTLSRCIETALKKNPSIIASEYTVDVNRSRVGQARSNYYPQLNASAAYDRINPLTRTAAAGGGLSAFELYSSSVTVNQNILDFGRTSSQVDISKYNLESSRSDLAATQDAVVLSVKQAYYGVLQARRNRDVAADVIKQFSCVDQARAFTMSERRRESTS
jgi:outer membrane protein TolC